MKLLFALLLIANVSYSQDISGVWIGYIETTGSKIYYELVLKNENKKIKGYALSNFVKDGQENIAIKTIDINLKKNAYFLEDDKLLYETFQTASRRQKLYATLSLLNETHLVLTGTFVTRSLDLRSPERYTGKIYLEKQQPTDSSLLLARLKQLDTHETLSSDKAIAKKSTPNKLDVSRIDDTVSAKPAKLITQSYSNTSPVTKSIENKSPLVKSIPDPTQRYTQVIEKVELEADSIIITLYDNGEIDGDSVSIFFNNKPVLLQQRLSTHPARKVIHTSQLEGNEWQLVMYAENLGAIPPNTGLMILEYGKEKKEIRFSCDMQKNASIVFSRKQ